jgi:hypothetical protein
LSRLYPFLLLFDLLVFASKRKCENVTCDLVKIVI